MARRISPLSIQKIFRKGTLASFIFLLLFTLVNLIDNYQLSQTIKLPSSDTPVELYSNQTHDDLTHLFQEAIASAKESITLLIYSLTDPQIIQALKKATLSSISVYIVCDAKASPGIVQHLPKATIVKRYGNGLMHQKILIVDNAKIWLGSANFTYNSLNIHGNLVMGIDNPPLAEALTSRAKSMEEDGAYAPLLHRETIASSQNIELWVWPTGQSAVQRIAT